MKALLLISLIALSTACGTGIFLGYDDDSNGGLIVVGENQIILASNDHGGSWTVENDTIASVFLNDVAYGNGRFVAVGDDGYIMTSKNGRQWDTLNLGLIADFRAITFSGNRFVAVGSSTTVYTSSDGYNWTSNSSGLPVASANLSAVACGGNFCMTTEFSGAVTTVYIANDLSTFNWSPTVLNPAAFEITDLAYSSGFFIGTNLNGAAVRTNDLGNSWSSDAVLPATFNALSIFQSDGRFIITGIDGNHYGANVSNGALSMWSHLGSINFVAASAGVQGFTYSGSYDVAIGDLGQISRRDNKSGANSWTSVKSQTTKKLQAIVAGNVSPE